MIYHGLQMSLVEGESRMEDALLRETRFDESH